MSKYHCIIQMVLQKLQETFHQLDTIYFVVLETYLYIYHYLLLSIFLICVLEEIFLYALLQSEVQVSNIAVRFTPYGEMYDL